MIVKRRCTHVSCIIIKEDIFSCIHGTHVSRGSIGQYLSQTSCVHVYRCEQPTLISVLCSQRQNIHGADGADGAGGAAREQNNEL